MAPFICHVKKQAYPLHSVIKDQGNINFTQVKFENQIRFKENRIHIL